MTMEAARRPSSRSNQPNVKAAQTPDQSTISTANARLIFYLKSRDIITDLGVALDNNDIIISADRSRSALQPERVLYSPKLFQDLDLFLV